MESKGKLADVTHFKDGYHMTFIVDDLPTDDLRGDLRISVKPWKEKRSNMANALLWDMLGKMARELGTDKWDVYLQMLKRYGKFTYVLVKPNAVEEVKRQWRETEVIGEVEVNGTKSVQLICYYGTSGMDTGEFSKFIDAVKSELAEMGLETPCSADMRRALELYEQEHNAK